jgi:NDP-sugar pyrophosphorylase family protein
VIPIAILAGGLGTRLRPLTSEMPKALVPIDGRPFIEHQLAMLAAHGFTRVVICAGHLGDMLEDAIRPNDHGLEVAYSYDCPNLLGTGGAIANALPLLGPRFGVLYGDTYPLYDLARICATHRNTITMAVRSPGQKNVRYARGRVLEYSKNRGLSHGDAGFSVFEAHAFYDLDGAFDLGDVFTTLAEHDCIGGYEVTEPVYEIGSFTGLADFSHHVLTR